MPEMRRLPPVRFTLLERTGSSGGEQKVGYRDRGDRKQPFVVFTFMPATDQNASVPDRALSGSFHQNQPFAMREAARRQSAPLSPFAASIGDPESRNPFMLAVWSCPTAA